MYDLIVIGAGFSGSTVARILAEKGKDVLVLEERDIGGNAYDYYDGKNLVHKYGPHIFHTNDEEVFSFINRFCKLNDYEHIVKANVHGKYINVPFNINAIRQVFNSISLEEKLISTYGEKVNIIKLKNSTDLSIKQVSDYIYENIFLHYTKKQWGTENIDVSVFDRVPIRLSDDDRYFQDKYQGLPIGGYTQLVKNILDHEKISIKIISSEDVLDFKDRIYFRGEEFSGQVIYTGSIDRLFNWRYGLLPYRSIDFKIETIDTEYYQDWGTVNYTVSEDFTRITEFKHMTKVKSDNTVIIKEYPIEYKAKDIDPYYPINNTTSMEIYNKYRELNTYNNLYFLGRLAEYKYYNIDEAIKSAIKLGNEII